MSSSSDNKVSEDSLHHSDPIPIASRFGRGRSLSVSTGSSASLDTPATPLSSSPNSQRISIPSPTGSPILSYFLGQSPTKSATFPFKRAFPPPVPEDEETDKDLPVATHMRRASLNVGGRFGQSQNSGPIPDSQLERGTGFLRRLSLSSSTFTKLQNDNTSPRAPSPPPNTAVNTRNKGVPFSPPKARRSTVSDGKRRRSPSPMGERILKGHFDGFN